jgi:hypothetical protein
MEFAPKAARNQTIAVVDGTLADIDVNAEPVSAEAAGFTPQQIAAAAEADRRSLERGA